MRGGPAVAGMKTENLKIQLWLYLCLRPSMLISYSIKINQ